MRRCLRSRWGRWYTCFPSEDIKEAYRYVRPLPPQDLPMVAAMKGDMQALDDADLTMWISMPTLLEGVSGVPKDFHGEAMRWLKAVMAEELLSQL